MVVQIEFSPFFVGAVEFLIVVQMIALAVLTFTVSAWIASAVLERRTRKIEEEDGREKAEKRR